MRHIHYTTKQYLTQDQPVFILRHRILQKKYSFTYEFQLVRIALPALIVLTEKPAAALVRGCRNSGPVLIPLNNTDIKIREGINIHPISKKRPAAHSGKAVIDYIILCLGIAAESGARGTKSPWDEPRDPWISCSSASDKIPEGRDKPSSRIYCCALLFNGVFKHLFQIIFCSFTFESIASSVFLTAFCRNATFRFP